MKKIQYKKEVSTNASIKKKTENVKKYNTNTKFKKK